MAPKSANVISLDRVQSALAELLKPIGFRNRGRTFRRTCDGDLVQVVNLQAGPYEIGPPPPKVFAWLRPNLHGLFTINLGVHIPEAFDRMIEGFAGTVHIQHCAVQTRLGNLVRGKEIWWTLGRGLDRSIDAIRGGMIEHGIPFLDHYADRNVIIRDHVAMDTAGLLACGRLDAVMILCKRGERAAAQAVLKEHWRALKAGPPHPGHELVVHDLSRRLGLSEPD